MVGRAVAVWFAILVLANVNGAVRQAWLIAPLGEVTGRAVSTLILSGLVLFVTSLAIRWIGPTTAGEALRVGALWLALTLGFEFLVGHYVFRKPWAALLEDYDVTRGRIWVLALIVVLLAPLLSARARGVLQEAVR